MPKRLFFLAILTSVTAFAQDGYWDKDRATSKEIMVPAGNRVIIKTEDFPIGTTEVVYRITVLDENQQMANSLVSLLKAIPDPSGISQGTAGAVFLVSKVSGDDKCKYAIFTNEDLAGNYKTNGEPEKACLYQNHPINKEAKVLSFGKSTCLTAGLTPMWFGFESNNWIMKQKIVLEVVPWVDRKASRGWNAENRKSVISLCKTSDLAKRIPNPDEFCVCILEKIQKEYNFNEYQNLLAAEKSKAYKDYGNSCLTETGVSGAIYTGYRDQAAIAMQQGKYGEAIAKLLNVVNDGKAKVDDYAVIGSAYIYTKQYEKAIKYLKIGEQTDDSELTVKLNLAHAYLLNGDYGSAKTIYKKYQSQNVSASVGWVQKVKSDFAAFEKAGLPSDNFAKILKLFK